MLTGKETDGYISMAGAYYKRKIQEYCRIYMMIYRKTDGYNSLMRVIPWEWTRVRQFLLLSLSMKNDFATFLDENNRVILLLDVCSVLEHVYH